MSEQKIVLTIKKCDMCGISINHTKPQFLKNYRVRCFDCDSTTYESPESSSKRLLDVTQCDSIGQKEEP